MASLFRRARQPSPQDAMKQIVEMIETLGKREEFLEKKIESERAEAKRLMGANNKRGAIMCLKKIKMYETQRDKHSASIMTLEQQLIAIENQKISMEVFGVMRQGAEILSQYNQQMDVNQVDRVMDNIQDQLDISNEINDALSQSLGVQFDEDELSAELDMLEEELNEPIVAPYTVPKTKVVAKVIDEEEELRQLELALAM